MWNKTSWLSRIAQASLNKDWEEMITNHLPYLAWSIKGYVDVLYTDNSQTPGTLALGGDSESVTSWAGFNGQVTMAENWPRRDKDQTYECIRKISRQVNESSTLSPVCDSPQLLPVLPVTSGVTDQTPHSR